MNADALAALRGGTLGDYISRQDFDLVLLHDFDVLFLDQRFPIWRQHYKEAGTFGTLFVFARRTGSG
jgi:hypothetical protein